MLGGGGGKAHDDVGGRGRMRRRVGQGSSLLYLTIAVHLWHFIL